MMSSNASIEQILVRAPIGYDIATKYRDIVHRNDYNFAAAILRGTSNIHGYKTLWNLAQKKRFADGIFKYGDDFTPMANTNSRDYEGSSKKARVIAPKDVLDIKASNALHLFYSEIQKGILQLKGNYILLPVEIGKGKFGVVRYCMSKLNGRLLACKSVSKNVHKYNGTLGPSVRAEIEATKITCGHPNVMYYEDVIEDTHNVHFVMEACSGKDLFELLSKRKRLPEYEAAIIFRGVVSGVAHCHSKGLMHRDIKPENIMLSMNCGYITPKLGDFGHSVILASGKYVRGIAGSPSYIAPEVIRNCNYDFSADVWSLGVLLYVMLSGLLPYYGNTTSQTFAMIINREPDFDIFPWNEISDSAKALVVKLLNRDPESRPKVCEILNDSWLQ